MVYFGPRRYRNSPKGLSRSDRVRIFAPILLLVALFAFLYDPDPTAPGVELAAPVAPISSPDEGVVDIVLPPGSEVPQVGTLPPPVDPNSPPGPFVVNPAILAAVRDAEAVDPGDPEEAGLIYLFHRWRSAGSAERGELPEYSGIPSSAPSLRGTRHQLILSLIESPQRRILEDNTAGVLRYWEVFGQDGDGHLHKVDFVDKSSSLPSGSEVVVEADFLRMFRYRTRSGIEGQVPEWVTTELAAYQPPVVESSGGMSLKIVGSISLVGLLALVLMGRGEPRARSKVRRKKGGGDGA